MSLTIPIETSARHIHITQQDFETLFGPGAKTYFCKRVKSARSVCLQRTADCRRTKRPF